MSDATRGSASDEQGIPGRRPVGDRRTWLTVARKDVADAARSWQAYVLAAVFTTATLVRGLEPVLEAAANNVEDTTYTAHDGLLSLAASVEVVVPLVALLFGHVAIAGDHERGSLRTLLALPVSRRDVLLGTLLGRVGVLWATLAVGLILAAVPMWFAYGDLDVLTYAGFSAAILVLGTVFVTMAVGISAASRTSGRALTWSLFIFVLTTFLWELLLWLQQFITGVSPEIRMDGPNIAPGWYLLLDRVQPGTAWRHVVNEWVVQVLPDRVESTPEHEPFLTTPGPEPFYLDEWALLLGLLAWGALPLVIGYFRFKNLEIG